MTPLPKKLAKLYNQVGKRESCRSSRAFSTSTGGPRGLKLGALKPGEEAPLVRARLCVHARDSRVSRGEGRAEGRHAWATGETRARGPRGRIPATGAQEGPCQLRCGPGSPAIDRTSGSPRRWSPSTFGHPTTKRSVRRLPTSVLLAAREAAVGLLAPTTGTSGTLRTQPTHSLALGTHSLPSRPGEDRSLSWVSRDGYQTLTCAAGWAGLQTFNTGPLDARRLTSTSPSTGCSSGGLIEGLSLVATRRLQTSEA